MKKAFQIPLLNLKREYQFLKKDIDCQIKGCLSIQNWILGQKVVEFEKAVAKYLGAKHAIGVASGTDALILSLRALAIKLKNKEYFDKRDEIITTPFTFVATAEAIIRSGATPVFVDIDPLTFTIDPERIKSAITKNTVGILPVHLYGGACDMGRIVKLAKENNLFIVEDVAQAFGAESGVRSQSSEVRRKLGVIGDCGAFSFFPSKNLGACGDGGLIVTNSQPLAEAIAVLRNHGQTKPYIADYIGYNSRLDALQAAILSVKLKHIDKFNAQRRRVAARYQEAFGQIKELATPKQPKDSLHAYNLYTIQVKENLRDKLLGFLNSRGVGARVYYPRSLHLMKAFRAARVVEKLTHTRSLTARVISLPIHPFLKEEEIDHIIDTVKLFFWSLSPC
jgi:dTDP-4-amino-4,6-dideoxygalactose transaminase